MNDIAIVFPNQLFREIPFNDCRIYLIEEYLYFKQYRFHQQKIAFHRATMKFYYDFLSGRGFEVVYVESQSGESDIREFLRARLIESSVENIHVYDPEDDWLQNRIAKLVPEKRLIWYPNQLFLNDKPALAEYFGRSIETYHMADFYKIQRKKFGILMRGDQPTGGKWSFDAENRKKFPSGRVVPALAFPCRDSYYKEAVTYTKTHFKANYGEVSDQPRYPVTYDAAGEWFEDFLNRRFHGFGPYEDSIVSHESVLHHSVLSPLINVGLISPAQVVERAVEFAEAENVPLNSFEGFIRQVIGWREFIRGVYAKAGRRQRLSNKLNHHRTIPQCFYDGTTGILPIDQTIKKLLSTGYTHHIERLMLLSNFMNLCGFEPDQVYQWFMEMYVDAYDWVMVPNVYGMALYADGGLMSTKPYISGSNYIRKMSDYPAGDWEAIWDGLYWNFIDANKSWLSKNHRMSLIVANWERMPQSKTSAFERRAQVSCQVRIKPSIQQSKIMRLSYIHNHKFFYGNS